MPRNTLGLCRRTPELTAERRRGLAYARAWRERMRPYFDAIYGADTPRGDVWRRLIGLERARRWRREQPAKAMLDAIYGAEGV